MMDKLGENLKKKRIEKGFSQTDLAQKIGVSRQCISSWETDRTEPDTLSLGKMALLYNCDLDALVGEPIVKPTVSEMEKYMEYYDEPTLKRLIAYANYLILKRSDK